MRRILLTVTILPIAMSCADAAEQRDVVVRDSTGVRIVENNTPLWRPGEEWTIDPEPVLQIGAVEGEEAYQFTLIRDATRRTDGVIAISERRAGEVRVFGPTGVHVRTVGRVGGGPGEFSEGPQIVWAAPDTLLAWDRRQQRMTWFDDEGNLLRERSLDDALASLAMDGIRGASATWQVLPDGTLIAAGLETGSNNDVVHRTQLLRLLSPDGSVTPLGDYDDGEAIRSSGGMLVMHSFTAYSLSTVRPRPFAAFVTRGGGREVTQFNADGDVVAIVRIAVARIPIDEAMLEAERESWRGAAERNGVPHSAALEPYAQLSMPDSLPAVNALRVDGSGHLWLGRRTEPDWSAPDTFDVLDLEGRWLGTVGVPEDAGRIYEIGNDYVLAGWSDELNVPYLRMYRIVK